MRFEEARVRGKFGAKANFPHLLSGLRAFNVVLGYLLIAKIAESWLALPANPFILIAIFAISFGGFTLLDRVFKRETYPRSEYLVNAGTLLFFGFIWLMFGR